MVAMSFGLDTPIIQNAAGGLAALVVLLLFLALTPRPRPLGQHLFTAGCAVVLLSFVVALLAETRLAGQMALFDAGSPDHQLVTTGLRAILGLPLVLAGALLGMLGRRRPKKLDLPPEPRLTKRFAEAQEKQELEKTLAQRREELESAKETLQQRVSEASQVEAKLRETLNLLLSSDEKFRALFDRSGEGLLEVDFKSRTVKQANARMAELLGTESTLLVGKSIEEVLGPQFRSVDLVEIAERHTKPMDPFPLPREDGAEVKVSAGFALIAAGEKPGLLVFIRDTSERDRLEKEVSSRDDELRSRDETLKESSARLADQTETLRSVGTKLRELKEVKDNFLASLAAELGLPQASLRSFSDLLLHCEGADDEVRKEFVTQINTEAERLARAVDSVLTLAGLQSGQMTFSMSVLRVDDLVAEAVGALKPMAAKRGMSIQVLLPEELPAVEGDRSKLQRVVTTLLTNAVRLGRTGSVVEIRGRSRDVDGVLEFAVDSPGPIVADEEQIRVLALHHHGVDAPEKKERDSMGLSLSRDLLMEHEGMLWVETSSDQGISFNFLLKARPGSPPPEPQVKLEQPVRAAVPESGGDIPGLKREPAIPPLAATRPPGRPGAKRGLPPLPLNPE